MQADGLIPQSMQHRITELKEDIILIQFKLVDKKTY